MITGGRGTELLPPPFSYNFLFTYLFSIQFLYFFIISSLFLILTCSCPYSYSLMLTVTYMFRPYLYNYLQGKKLLKFKNRPPARFVYI